MLNEVEAMSDLLCVNVGGLGQLSLANRAVAFNKHAKYCRLLLRQWPLAQL
jgi:hypothetical protein